MDRMSQSLGVSASQALAEARDHINSGKFLVMRSVRPLSVGHLFGGFGLYSGELVDHPFRVKRELTSEEAMANCIPRVLSEWMEDKSDVWWYYELTTD